MHRSTISILGLVVASGSLFAALALSTKATAQQASAKTTGIASSPNVETRFCKQTRYGRYQVLSPAHIVPGNVYPLVLLLHGNGNTPDLMIEWARSLHLDSVIFICPEAPYLKSRESFETHQEKYTAMGDAIGTPEAMTPDVISLSCEWYYDVVRDAQQSLPVNRSIRPVIVGFSQGGFYSHVLATRHPDAFGGVVSICASMYTAGKVVERYSALASYNLEFLVAHGRMDPIVPFQTAELIHASLLDANIRHEFLPFAGGHWPTAEANDRIRSWIVLHLQPA